MSYRLLALDLDGTLLDPAGALSQPARAAVAAARDAGLEVVLCTGRRFRTALPVLRALELGGVVVVNNGAVVKEVASGRTLHPCYVSADLYPEALRILRSAAAPLVYVDTFHEDTDFLTESQAKPHPFQQEYLEEHAAHCRFVADLAATARDDVIMLSLMADEASLRPLGELAQAALGARVKTHLIVNKNYRGHILELFSPLSGKWAALERVARGLGVPPEEIAAIGDDRNDADLLRGAGLGIAMGNAVDEVKAAADLVVRGNDADGVVEAIERVLRGR
jgi:Cof subfamily protein (haloacid dehalogenase superfamily)